MLQNFGKEKGISFVVVDDYSGHYALINGEQLGDTNKIIINLDAEGGLLLRTAAHEVYHYLEQESPEAARKMRDFVVDHYVKEGRYESLAQQYAAQDLARDIDGELTADNLFDVMTQEGFLQKYAAEDAKTVKTLRNTLAAFVRHINSALQKLTLTNPIHREIYESLTKDKKAMENLRRMFNDALDELNENGKPAGGKRQDEKKYSLRTGVADEVRRAIDNKNYTEDVYLTESTPAIIASQKELKTIRC